jgi:hypothetical protein
VDNENKIALYNIKGWLIAIVVGLSLQGLLLGYVLYRLGF